MIRPALALGLLLLSIQVAHAQERSFSTYGYFDLEYEISNEDEAGRRGTFDQHHFNVLSSYVLDEHFRVFGEIEWEHGLELSDGGGVGEVKLERAWVEYRASDALKVRGGKFLTPYGLYNLIHDATPTFLSTFLPASLYGKHTNPLGESQRLFAKFATGIQVLGTVFADDWTVEYAAYLSNGRGVDPFEQDDNDDKALGGRLIVGTPLDGLQVGSSYYTDVNGQAADTRQRNLAFDVVGERGAWELQAEAALGRMQRLGAGGEPGDSYQKTLGAYAQLAYTVAERYTPFARFDRFDPDTTVGGDAETHTVLGLNVAVTPRVYLKGEVHLARFERPERESFEMFVSSIAVAF